MPISLEEAAFRSILKWLVIRNEALLLLTYLTREAEEIQKIVVFEGAFEKIFSIIKEEGGSEGGVVVQDCLQLLNNLLRTNASNQILLRETMGFDPVISILKLRGSTYSFTQQKTINLLSALETINLLMMGGTEADPGKDANKLTNKATLVQKKVLDHLLLLGVESQWAPVAVRCASEEDLALKQQLELYVERVQDADPNLQIVALESMRQEIRTSTSSMTSVPKPLKFPRPHYGTLKAFYETMGNSELKKYLVDILFVLALTMSVEGERESLKYRLEGSGGDIGSWGHEYVRNLAGEISQEYAK
ncbi:golgin candidate 6-like [Quercus robur]|uniref:golgin candidate 6-like n=1 Tax=Quercus robur TaxID=38942 RepID=UPI002161BE42|nr:golgin candidate 6-like [Quercus robur]